MKQQRAIFSVLLFLFFATLCVAQKNASSLRVRVVDPSAASIASASVFVSSAHSSYSAQCATDSAGSCLFASLPPGDYAVSVEAAGFARQTLPLTLLIDQPAAKTFRLAVKAESATIVVNSDAASLNTADASFGNAVDNKTIEALPMEGRNVPDLLANETGVLYLGRAVDQAYDSRNGAISGGRSDQGNMSLDGVDNNDRLTGYAFNSALRSTLDSVEEFRVSTVGYGSDSGYSSGAQVNLMTRSGGDQLHASFYEYNRSRIGEANNWFHKQVQTNAGQPNRPGKLVRNTFGASAGGPIRSNRAFFFVNYEGQRTAENKQPTLVVPTTSMRAGNLQYWTDNSSTPVLLTPADIAGMDPSCSSNGTCPWGPGVDPNVLSVLSQYPTPNSTVAGDGLNTAAYSWSAPNPAALNTVTARFDFVPSHAHLLFARGTLQQDSSSATPLFPGMPASATGSDNNKGIALGDFWTPTNHLSNNLRYGFTRQSQSSRGIGQGQYANFYNIAPIEAETRTTLSAAPMHNVADDLTWTRGAHTLQWGMDFRAIEIDSQSDALSYNYGYTNAYALLDAGIAGTGQSLDPGAFGYASVSSSFSNAYSFAAANLTGLLDYVTDQANYEISADGKTAALLSQGAMLSRAFRNHEFESYLQDSWRPRAGLTITAGVRYSFSQTPYEIHGQQVQPTVDMRQWFETRAAQAKLGDTVQPDLYFAPSGKARGGKPYWPAPMLDFAPRFSLAYSPKPKGWLMQALFGGEGQSVIRAGYGMYFDHFGSGIVRLFDQAGSFGLSQSTTNPTNVLTPDDSPRFTGLHDLPQITAAAATSITYPSLAPNDPFGSGFAIAHGIDDHLKTPYVHSVELSFQRELPAAFTLEVAYAGRFGRHLLQQIDLAEPLDLVDPASGEDYFTAAAELSKQKAAGAQTISAVPFFEHLFPDAAISGKSATQNIYDSVWFPGNETGSLYMLDILCTPGCNNGQTNRFWTRQFASLYSWSSIGTSSYNALQASLLRRMTRGLELKVGYTYSKSIDLGSDAERTQFSSSTGTSSGSSFSAIVNSWNPRLNRGPSDFDVRHLLTSTWVAELPVGRGQRFLGDTNRRLDAIIGGWIFSGLARWTSGLPFSVVSGAGWGTNWDEKSYMVQTGPIRTHTHMVNGAPNAFADPTAALANLRNPYPGEAGQRNNFRGDGYFGVDTGLSKSWTVRNRDSIKFSWEVFNLTNSVRFDVNPITSLQNITTNGQLGAYSAALTNPRVQQFSLRYSY